MWKPVLIAVVLTVYGCSGSNDFEAAAEDHSGGLDCTEVARCNGIVKVDCQSAVDGPLFYFDEASHEVISTCGGACFVPMDPQQQEVCRTLCPPPAFTCAR